MFDMSKMTMAMVAVTAMTMAAVKMTMSKMAMKTTVEHVGYASELTRDVQALLKELKTYDLVQIERAVWRDFYYGFYEHWVMYSVAHLRCPAFKLDSTHDFI